MYFFGLYKLLCKSNTTKLIGNLRKQKLLTPKYQKAYLSPDAIAFAILSRTKLDFLANEIKEINVQSSLKQNYLVQTYHRIYTLYLLQILRLRDFSLRPSACSASSKQKRHKSP